MQGRQAHGCRRGFGIASAQAARPSCGLMLCFVQGWGPGHARRVFDHDTPDPPRPWLPCCSTPNRLWSSLEVPAQEERGAARCRSQAVRGKISSCFPWKSSRCRFVRSRINRCSGTYDPFSSATCPCFRPSPAVILFLSFHFDGCTLCFNAL